MIERSEEKTAVVFYGGFAARSGGAFMHATTLSQGLRARGWSVSIVTLDCLPFAFRYLPHIVERLVNRFAPPLGFYYKGIATRILYRYMVDYKKAELLVFEDVYLGWSSQKPSVSLLHAVWSDNLQAYDYSEKQVDRLKQKEKQSIERLSHPVITVSRPYRDYLVLHHFCKIGKINLGIVELGLDFKRERGHSKANAPELARSLIYCGALEARKNVFFMLKVFAMILAADHTASLTIIGDGPDREGLEEYANQLQLTVAFLGRLNHEQVLDEIAKNNIYIHTALKESFSFSLLEAKLTGLTTCALAHLEVPEQFIDVGFNDFDAVEWSTRILAIKGKPDLEGFPDYSIDRMTDNTLALISTA